MKRILTIIVLMNYGVKSKGFFYKRQKQSINYIPTLQTIIPGMTSIYVTMSLNSVRKVTESKNFSYGIIIDYTATVIKMKV